MQSKGEVAKTVFFDQEMWNQRREVLPSNSPLLLLVRLSGWSSSSAKNLCCFGDNCNSAPKIGSGSLSSRNTINGALTGMSILLALWGLSYFCKNMSSRYFLFMGFFL